MAGLHRKFVTAGGFTFSYLEREGTSSPQTAAAPHVTAVFVPGFSASKAMWTPVSVYFPPEWKVVMVDMPGHGESTFIPGADYSAYGMARKLHDVSITMQSIPLALSWESKPMQFHCTLVPHSH